MSTRLTLSYYDRVDETNPAYGALTRTAAAEHLDPAALELYTVRVMDEDRACAVPWSCSILVTPDRYAIEAGGDWAWAERSAFDGIEDAIDAYLNDPDRYEAAN